MLAPSRQVRAGARAIAALLLLSAAIGVMGARAGGKATPAAGAPLGLEALAAPPDNPGSAAKIDLGRKLFMDRRMSHNNTMSCAMCHVPEQGFTSNELGAAIGLEGRSLRRNAPTILNAAYFGHLFHDGRETSLENQVWGPLLNPNEMANPSIGYVIGKIRSLRDYDQLFERAFGRGPTVETIGQAIAAYERTLISGSSRFDLWYYGKQRGALDASEQRGFDVFRGKGRCASCHVVGESSALLSDDRFHNTGVGYAASMRQSTPAATHKVQLAPGMFVQVDAAIVQSFSEPEQNDVGRYEITLDPADRWAYRTPTLRNVALTAPYMHDGSFATLAQVVEFYDRGGTDNPERDPLITPLGLSAAEKTDLVAFLGTLTGGNVKALAADARTAEEHHMSR